MVGHMERHCKFLTKNSKVLAFRETLILSGKERDRSSSGISNVRRDRKRWKKCSCVEINLRREFCKFSKQNIQNSTNVPLNIARCELSLLHTIKLYSFLLLKYYTQILMIKPLILVNSFETNWKILYKVLQSSLRVLKQRQTQICDQNKIG